jgi:Mg-chelatase subunit ChlD
VKRIVSIFLAFAIVSATLLSTQAQDNQNSSEATIAALQTQLATLMTPTPGIVATPTSAETGADDVSAPQVNIEFILDASGSMANLTDTGETRMDAAKRVLHDVVASIPDREDSVNVGFRLYGHIGDSSEATKEESCRASDLIVPVDGLDRDALNAAIDSAQPTGWTPIARSLARAGKDFPPAGPNVINAVVLVTDGLETCDLDPVEEAEDFHNRPEVQMITHVIGFGTTPEEQQVLQGIADAGGGLLLGAGNAGELRSALFSILEDLQILVGVGYVGGNAFSMIPPGEPGKLTVVAYSAPTSFGEMYVLIKNNTGEDVTLPKVSMTARDPAGTLVGAGDVTTVNPFFVRAGGVAIGTIYTGVAFPPDTTYEFNVSATPYEDARFYTNADLDIVEAAFYEDRIVGVAENGFDGTVDGPTGFIVACFDDSGAMTGGALGFSNSGAIPAGETQSFQVDLNGMLYEGRPCSAFLVAGSGYGTPRLPA